MLELFTSLSLRSFLCQNRISIKPSSIDKNIMCEFGMDEREGDESSFDTTSLQLNGQWRGKRRQVIEI